MSQKQPEKRKHQVQETREDGSAKDSERQDRMGVRGPSNERTEELRGLHRRSGCSARVCMYSGGVRGGDSRSVGGGKNTSSREGRPAVNIREKIFTRLLVNPTHFFVL